MIMLLALVPVTVVEVTKLVRAWVAQRRAGVETRLPQRSAS
jgi:hypothetical protein